MNVKGQIDPRDCDIAISLTPKKKLAIPAEGCELCHNRKKDTFIVNKMNVEPHTQTRLVCLRTVGKAKEIIEG